jgi:hypothetical protein
VKITKSLLRCLSTLILLIVWKPSLAANFEIARHPKLPSLILGLTIEGDIAQGDSERLVAILGTFGPKIGTIFLYSRGGDLQEAIKIGRTIRRLRLATETAVKFPGEKPACLLPKASKPENCGCMSACFLAFAGGVWRYGNHLGLHRPYLSRESMLAISDLEFERRQEAVSKTIRAYLEEMNIPAELINTMFNRSSRDLYLVDKAEAEDSGLVGYVPMLEEILIARCADLSDADQALARKLAPKALTATMTDDEQHIWKRLSEASNKHVQCERDAMRKIRSDAFEREFGPHESP